MLIVGAQMAAFSCFPGSLAAAETPRDEASLRVHSVRLSRGSADLGKKFSSRYGEGSPGVSLQLALTLREGMMLPVAREAVTIDTFIDDTYQSLLSADRTNYYGGTIYYSGSNPHALSDDSRTLLFTVAATRPPAEQAGRVFVRGSVQARLGRDKATVATGQVPVTVGQEVTVGGFRTVIRSVTFHEVGGSVSVMLSVEGDAFRIQKVRVLEGDTALHGDQPVRFTMPESGVGTGTASVMLRSMPKGPVTLEYTYLEKIESVRIPFEAQVDIGVAKAGPIEAGETKGAKPVSERKWPPPPPPRDASGQVIPPRRPAFEPGAGPKVVAAKPEVAELRDASVDLFSITVAKSGPIEGKGVAWKNSPAPELYATGFTVARLMLTAPGATILSIPADGVQVSRYEDDKGARLDTSLYREHALPFYPASHARRSFDGQQVLLTVSLASAPSPGAARCTLAGHVRARVARKQLRSTAALELRSGEKFTAGPFTGEVGRVRQLAPLTPESGEDGGTEAYLSITGPLAKVRSTQLLDSAGTVVGQGRSEGSPSWPERATNLTHPFRLRGAPKGTLTLRIDHYESEETVEVPFNISTGIGL
jgi:hypothetical protein